MNYKIADLLVQVNIPSCLCCEEFEPFRTEEDNNPDIVWNIEQNDRGIEPPSGRSMDFSGFHVYANENKTCVLYDDLPRYLVAWITYEDHYSKASFYLRNKVPMSGEEQKKLRSYLFLFFREAFFLALIHWNGISLHSASIIYRQRGIAFSAMSQTGKSTHTNLWKKRYGTPILDGDLAACRIQKNRLYLYGLPWCGTSGLTMNRRVELEAVVFLRQSMQNQAESMQDHEVIQSLYARSFTSLWLPDLVRSYLKLVTRVQQLLPQVYQLQCRPDEDAVDVIKRVLDEHWKI